MLCASTTKYFGEQDARYGGELHWPGIHGIPFRGDAIPNLKKQERDNLPVVASAHHQLFNLSDTEQSRVYAWVRDRIRNGLFTCDYVERWHDQTNNVWVYLEWSQLYTQLPKNTGLGSNGNGNGSPYHFTLRSPE